MGHAGFEADQPRCGNSKAAFRWDDGPASEPGYNGKSMLPHSDPSLLTLIYREIDGLVLKRLNEEEKERIFRENEEGKNMIFREIYSDFKEAGTDTPVKNYKGYSVVIAGDALRVLDVSAAYINYSKKSSLMKKAMRYSQGFISRQWYKQQFYEGTSHYVQQKGHGSSSVLLIELPNDLVNSVQEAYDVAVKEFKITDTRFQRLFSSYVWPTKPDLKSHYSKDVMAPLDDDVN